MEEGSFSGIQLNSILAVTATGVFFVGVFVLWAYAERIGVSIGLDQGTISSIIGVSIGLGFIGALAAGFIEDRFGRYFPVLLICSMHCLLIALLWFTTLPLGFIVAIGLLQFFSYNFAGPTLFGVIAATDTSGRCSVLYNVVMGVSAFLGPLVGGILFDYDPTFTATYIASAMAAVIMLVLALMVLRTVKPEVAPQCTAS